MQLIDKLILGTVQLGLEYGINNSSGKPTTEQAVFLLETAYKSGVKYLDTAEAYGNAQEVIGTYHKTNSSSSFNIITKCKKGNETLPRADFLKNYLQNLEQLNVSKLEAYLFHSYEQYKTFNNWDVLYEMQQIGKLSRVGVSVYTNEEAIEVAGDERISIVQLPFNLLDNSAQRGFVLEFLKKNNKEVHTRSIFLQGLFFKDRTTLGKLQPLQSDLEQLDKIAAKSNCDLGLLALAYAFRQPLIDKVLIGVDSYEQLKANINLMEKVGSIDSKAFEEIDQINISAVSFLNPSTW